MAQRLIKSRTNKILYTLSSSQAGDIKVSIATVSPGWIPCNGKSIGKVSGDFIGENYKELYNILWSLDGLSTVDGNPFVISSSKGSSADEDWNSGKTIKIDFSSREVFIRTKGSSRALGSYQEDAFQDHAHDFYMEEITYAGGSFSTSDTMSVNNSGTRHLSSETTNAAADIINDPVEINSNGTPRVSNETRVKNVALNYFIKY